MTDDSRATPMARKPLIPNGVFGMIIFVLTEIMFFAGLISAHTIVKSNAAEWPPPGQPRLPMEATALNTLALLASGIFLYLAHRALMRGLKAQRASEPAQPTVDPAQRARVPMALSLVLASIFVLFQGMEWTQLIAEGLSLQTTHGGFFYLIVGTHAAHVIAAIGMLAWVFVGMLRQTLKPEAFYTAEVFWYFVVGIWPLIYYQVYL